MNVYAIYDKVTGIWANPFVLDAKVEQRTMKWLKEDTEAHDREDKTVFQIGEYDNTTGKLKPLEVSREVAKLDD